VVILSGLQPAPGALNPSGALLSPEQTRRLQSAVSGSHPEHDVAGCHLPHNAFVFYDGTRPVAFFEVCFECFSKRSAPRGASKYSDLREVAGIFTELQLPLGKYGDAKAFEAHFKKHQ